MARFWLEKKIFDMENIYYASQKWEKGQDWLVKSSGH